VSRAEAPEGLPEVGGEGLRVFPHQALQLVHVEEAPFGDLLGIGLRRVLRDEPVDEHVLAFEVALEQVALEGLGFGRRLFNAARKDLVQSGLKSLVVWALSDNEPAVEFYRALGGRAVARSSERFGQKTLDKVAYAWQG